MATFASSNLVVEAIAADSVETTVFEFFQEPHFTRRAFIGYKGFFAVRVFHGPSFTNTEKIGKCQTRGHGGRDRRDGQGRKGRGEKNSGGGKMIRWGAVARFCLRVLERGLVRASAIF